MKKVVILTLLICLFTTPVFADGWVDDGYGNWLYEENGNYVRNDWRTIDGVTYYFNYQGYWLPKEPVRDVKLKNKEKVSFVIEGKDYDDRKYKTEIIMPMPVVEGKNSVAINEFINNEFKNVMTKYFTEWEINLLFLTPKIEIDEMLEGQNKNGVICFSYFGGQMLNLYLDTNKMEMWAMPNRV